MVIFKFLIMIVFFMGWFILSTFIINKGDKESLWKKGF
tara:strand:+ start:623 stop:736 length:114 start_codon:yes stop_codon:yes gene_type:complete